MSQRYLGGIITANPTTPTMTSESGVWTLEQQFQYSSVWSPEIIGNSLRFRSSASAYLNRTYGVASTNNKKGTVSFWVKRGKLGTSLALFGAYDGSSTASSDFYFNSSDQLQLDFGGSSSLSNITSAVFRDPSAWYHIVVSIDTTNATSTSRVAIYVNNVLQTLGTSNAPALNAVWQFVSQTANNKIGSKWDSSIPFDGYMAEIYFVDGQALTPSSFGAFDSTGVWQPLGYTGTYGTNGFYIDFSDNSGTTSTTLGKDYSGNGNNWTPNNFSLTAGATYDWMLDTPTNSDNGGTGRGNYPTLNPLWYTTSGAGTLSNGNLTFTQSSGVVYGTTYSTMTFPSIGATGKYYFEFVFTNGLLSDVNQGGGVYNAANTSDYAIVQPKSGSTVFNRSGTTTSSGTGYSFNNVLQVAIDTATGKIWFGQNNTWYSGDPAAGTSPTYSDLTSGASYVPGFTSYSNSVTGQVNFGQQPFTYTPPTGFKALNTQNLPDSTIKAGNKYFDIALWSGNNASSRDISTNLSSVGFTWVKNRTNALGNSLVDIVRGGGKSLFTQSTNAESTNNGNGYQSAFSSGTFTLTRGSTDGTNVNETGSNYVGWAWTANGAGSSNTSGSITSTVSVNATAGFSVVTYTGTGANATVGHGLGVAPSMVIVKGRNYVSNFNVWHTGLTSAAYDLQLNTTTNQFSSPTMWNSTAPTSSVFSIGTSADINVNTNTYVAYCWAAVAGYSAFGSYTGNGSADGTFVYTGFRPRWLMTKRSSTGGTDWYILDTSRSTYNQSQLILQADLSNAESDNSTLAFDLLSNGFKARTTGTAVNQSGETYIYVAFAENPFKIARAR